MVALLALLETKKHIKHVGSKPDRKKIPKEWTSCVFLF